MTLENQLTNQELSKRLKELGVKQESYFDWCEGRETKAIEIHSMASRLLVGQPHRSQVVAEHLRTEKIIAGERFDRIASAFTVAELGEMLPDTIISDKENGKMGEYFVTFQPFRAEPPALWMVALDGCTTEFGSLHQVGAPTEADARAKMLIYLLENKLITI